MRAVSIVAIALVLLAGAATAFDAQGSPRSVEDRWKNCSQIVQGRMAALNSEGTNVVAFDSFANGTYALGSLNPCGVDGKPFANITRTIGIDISTILFQSAVSYDASGRLFDFVMPEVTGQVPLENAQYSTSLLNPTYVLAVTYKCNAAFPRGNTTFLWLDGNTFRATVETVDACARFPTTNSALPAGGVAAMIIVILCFVLEFAAYVKYHRDNKEHSPVDTA